jgi:retron-type reverse transcriptase
MKLDLEKAFNSILRDNKRKGNPIPDPLSFAYFNFNKKKILKEIEEQIKTQPYPARQLLTIDVPKPNYTIRPMARPEIQDWIVYQACVDYIVPKVINKVSKRSFSIQNFKNPKRGSAPWKEFDGRSRQFYNSEYEYVVATDISGYFENINLIELRNKLINYIDRNDNESREVINFLYQYLLFNWSSGRVENFGLPQGPSASSFLGDIYLDNVDREMEIEKGYIRYMDDIRIFCKTKTDAKLALIKIIKSLRKYKLNINAKKTRILIKNEVEKELFDPKKTILDSIQNAFDSKNLSQIKAIIPILREDVFAGGFSRGNPFGKRHLNFAIFRLSVLKSSGIDFNDDYIVNLIQENFIEYPDHADDFCSFFALYPKNKKIFEFLVDFLDKRENIYEWQELHVLMALLEMSFPLNSTILKKFLKKFKDRNRHWALRALYCLLIGKYGKNADRELLIDEFDIAETDELRKSIILSVQELGFASRNEFYKKAESRIWPLDFIHYVKNLKRPMYFYTFEPIKIETFEQLGISGDTY